MVGRSRRRAASLARRRGRAEFDDLKNENVSDRLAAGEVEFMFEDRRIVKARINKIVIGYDSVRYVDLSFYEDCYVGLCNGDPRNTLLPIYSDVQTAFRYSASINSPVKLAEESNAKRKPQTKPTK